MASSSIISSVKIIVEHSKGWMALDLVAILRHYDGSRAKMSSSSCVIVLELPTCRSIAPLSPFIAKADAPCSSIAAQPLPMSVSSPGRGE